MDGNKLISVYRYELNDGGGPFMTLDGFSRSNPQLYCNDGMLSGCLSLDELNNYFFNHNLNINNYQLKIYQVYEKDIIKTKKHVIFPKTYFAIN